MTINNVSHRAASLVCLFGSLLVSPSTADEFRFDAWLGKGFNYTNTLEAPTKEFTRGEYWSGSISAYHVWDGGLFVSALASSAGVPSEFVWDSIETWNRFTYDGAVGYYFYRSETFDVGVFGFVGGQGKIEAPGDDSVRVRAYPLRLGGGVTLYHRKRGAWAYLGLMKDETYGDGPVFGFLTQAPLLTPYTALRSRVAVGKVMNVSTEIVVGWGKGPE